ncbi:MAG: bifunctional riboflavin kinase/FAD synthetase [Alphaproteobacteria bacterium]|nr:bifunctional riboflavin kinase/FAD synthetase [Alphaproteobacteria bacterium]
MLIIRQVESLPRDKRDGVYAIGNFDGVHRGHRAVIEAAKAKARALTAPLGVVTFEPHPRRFFAPQLPPDRLTPFRPKASALEAIGVDVMVALHFDAALAATPAEDFARRILAQGLGARHVTVGYDFVFGKGRSGTTAELRNFGEAMGFSVEVIEPAGEGASVFSSTLIRKLLGAGKSAEASRLLGRPFEIDGHVQHGDKRGRTIGFPTANLLTEDYLQPAHGVYAVRVGIDAEHGGGAWHEGVANFGRRPTVGAPHPLLEVHLFDFTGDLYGKRLRVRFLDFLRPEKKFPDLAALKSQIEADSQKAREILARERR